ncbi:hypothetical protein M9458_000693, partial [Cirrhinus mrigala]
TISVIDTPGLYDTSISEEQLKNELERCIEMSVPGPHAFLLVTRLDLTLTDEVKNTVKWIQKNFGEDAALYTIILFTRGDQLKISIEQFLINNELFRELVEQCKGGYHVFNNTVEDNRSQVTELLQKIDFMVIENGGQHYMNEMYNMKAQRKKEEEEKRRKEDDERKKLEEEEKIRKDKNSRTVKKVVLAGATALGGVTAVVGTGLLAAATGGVALPAVLL